MKLSNGFEIISIPDYSHITDAAKTRWANLIAALRSGKYRQIDGSLRQETGFCCLGVACDLVVSDEANWEYGGKGGYVFRVGTAKEAAILPTPIRALYNFDPAHGAGFRCQAVVRDERLQSRDLASLNDDGVIFLEIADILEKALNGGYNKVKEQK
jgi:hypothetical protein